MLLFFFTVLLNDVKFTSEVFFNSLEYKNFIDKNNLLPLITVTGTVFAFFSIVILTFGDFSRYVKNESELKNHQLNSYYESDRKLKTENFATQIIGICIVVMLTLIALSFIL